MLITVRDAVLQAARFLGIEEGVFNYLDGDDSVVGERDTNLLLSCFQAVENELATRYYPLLCEEKVTTVTGKVDYDLLSRAPVKILAVRDEKGRKRKYRLFPDHLQTDAGSLTLVYAYQPEEKTMEGYSEYRVGASLQLFAYGMAAEYSLAIGERAEAESWERKYREAAEELRSGVSRRRMPTRRWA